MIVVVLLAMAQLSCGAVPIKRSLLDPETIEINDIEGFLYDVPEFEDPLVIQHQLSSMGAMPIFTLLESAKKRGNSKYLRSDDILQEVKISDTREVIDEVMSRLELARIKLEKGNANIHTDIEKAIQSLAALEKSTRSDIRQVLNYLPSIMTMARPIKTLGLKELLTTNEPESNEKMGVLEEPRALSIRVISDDKPEPVEKPALNDSQDSSQSFRVEKSSEEERMTEERSKIFASSEQPKESYATTKPPFEFKMKERKNTNFDGEDVMSSYKLTWKAAGVV